MSDRQRHWEMVDVRFGYIAFERCYQTDKVRAFFTEEDQPDLGDEYREGEHTWSRVENAQSFMFSLRCLEDGELVPFDDLMGLMYCTSCPPDCEFAALAKQHAASRTMILVAFGFDPEVPLPTEKLEILTDYFNQRRKRSRPGILIVPSTVLGDVARCRGDFIHDVGMLSPEPIQERKPIF